MSFFGLFKSKREKKIKQVERDIIDKITTKSTLTLAANSSRELGSLENKKHFTIIYVCQFCGRLINYSSTPCIFCCESLKTKREVIIAQALSSESMGMDSLLAVSKAVKNGKDLEVVVPDLKSWIDDVLRNFSQFQQYSALFKLAKAYLNNPDTIAEAKKISNKTKMFCDYCDNEIVLANKPCLYCITGNDKNVENNLTLLQKNIVALNGFLLFVENYLDCSNNKVVMTELIFVSVYTLNLLLEKDKLPDKDLKKYWCNLLLESKYFGSRKILHAGIEIDSTGKPIMVMESGKVDIKATEEIVRLTENILYFSKS